MTEELNVPNELTRTFNRLTRKIPAKFRNDDAVRKSTLVFLKLGGEKLAKARIEAFRVPFTEKFILKKMQLKDDDLIETPVINGASSAETPAEKIDAPNLEEKSAP